MTTLNDPRFIDYKPGTCKDCGAELRFATEVENGNLCSNCGPGSLKWQKGEAQRNDVEFVERSQQHTDLKGRHGALANSVRDAMSRGFDSDSVAKLKTVLEADEKASEANPMSNAEATEERMKGTVSTQETQGDSRERNSEESTAKPISQTENV